MLINSINSCGNVGIKYVTASTEITKLTEDKCCYSAHSICCKSIETDGLRGQLPQLSPISRATD